MTVLSRRYTDAVDYARIAHATQFRKGSRIPYLQHLLAVSSLVLEYGGNEDQAIAGLLHDVLEDCGAEHEATIRARFGDAVGDIVVACTDGSAEAKAAAVGIDARYQDWQRRKLAYLAHLRVAPDSVLLVSGCDKLHNGRSVVTDLEDPAVGTAVFARFTAGVHGTLRYYHSLSEIFRDRGQPMARDFLAIVDRMHALAGLDDGAVTRCGLG